VSVSPPHSFSQRSGFPFPPDVSLRSLFPFPFFVRFTPPQFRLLATLGPLPPFVTPPRVLRLNFRFGKIPSFNVGPVLKRAPHEHPLTSLFPRVCDPSVIRLFFSPFSGSFLPHHDLTDQPLHPPIPLLMSISLCDFYPLSFGGPRLFTVATPHKPGPPLVRLRPPPSEFSVATDTQFNVFWSPCPALYC